MKNPEAPSRVLLHLSIQQAGTETLVYDERRHKAFCLNRSSSAIWNLADGEHTIAEIGALASLQLETSVTEEFVLFALEDLRREGLIEPSATTEVVPAVSRRAMLQKLGVGGAMLLPAVAAILAPTAAQAQSGCFDCGDSIRATQMARARAQQPGVSGSLSPITSTGTAGTATPGVTPGVVQPTTPPKK